MSADSVGDAAVALSSRPGESWTSPDLDSYRVEKLIIVDLDPAPRIDRSHR